MIWLLVIATLAAPILAIVVAEKLRDRRRKAMKRGPEQRGEGDERAK